MKEKRQHRSEKEVNQAERAAEKVACKAHQEEIVLQARKKWSVVVSSGCKPA